MQFIRFILSGMLLCQLTNSCTKNTSDYFIHTNNDTAACKSCAYIPWCDSSKYYFVDSSSGGLGYKNITLRVLGDTVINGLTYQKGSWGSNIIYNNCSAGTTTQVTYGQLNGVNSAISKVLLKANQPVNTTWQDVFSSNGLTTTCNYKIITKSMNRQVLGRDYNDVTQVHQSISTSSSVFGTNAVSEGDYYYCRGIGLIEYQVLDANTDSLIASRRLQSYFIR